MRLTIKALGWIIRFLWIVTLLIPVTVAFSLMQLMGGNNLGVQEPNVTFQEGIFIMSAPFFINNTGFYDLSDVNLTLILRNSNQTLAKFTKTLPLVRAGEKVESSYTVSLTLEEIFSKSAMLLTNDTDLNMGVFASFRVAYAIALGISGTTIAPWGAPFHNLTVSEVAYNPSSQSFSILVSFQNHAYFPLNGTLQVELYNNRGELLGLFGQYLDVSPDTQSQTSIELNVIDPSKVSNKGVVRLYFEGMQILEKEWG